jgi:hypothetical protein
MPHRPRPLGMAAGPYRGADVPVCCPGGERYGSSEASADKATEGPGRPGRPPWSRRAKLGTPSDRRRTVPSGRLSGPGPAVREDLAARKGVGPGLRSASRGSRGTRASDQHPPGLPAFVRRVRCRAPPTTDSSATEEEYRMSPQQQTPGANAETAAAREGEPAPRPRPPRPTRTPRRRPAPPPRGPARLRRRSRRPERRRLPGRSPVRPPRRRPGASPAPLPPPGRAPPRPERPPPRPPPPGRASPSRRRSARRRRAPGPAPVSTGGVPASRSWRARRSPVPR